MIIEYKLLSMVNWRQKVFIRAKCLFPKYQEFFGLKRSAGFNYNVYYYDILYTKGLYIKQILNNSHFHPAVSSKARAVCNGLNVIKEKGGCWVIMVHSNVFTFRENWWHIKDFFLEYPISRLFCVCLFVCHPQATLHGFWNGVDLRTLVED